MMFVSRFEEFDGKLLLEYRRLMLDKPLAEVYAAFDRYDLQKPALKLNITDALRLNLAFRQL